jgi:hypothetical protein
MRGWRRYSGIVAAGALCALAVPPATWAGNPPITSPAASQQVSAGGAGKHVDKNEHSYIAKGSACIIGTARPGTYAKVSFLMQAGPYPATKVTNFILHARMIPHGQNLAVQNFTRPWATQVGPWIGGGTASHNQSMTTWALVPDIEKDWDLQVKLQWKRDLARDWNTTLKIQFNEAACPEA